jgi:hypothetical protein
MTQDGNSQIPLHNNNTYKRRYKNTNHTMSYAAPDCDECEGIVLATRIHLRKANHPRTEQQWREQVQQMQTICDTCDAIVAGVMAVDAEPIPKFPEYNLVQVLQSIVEEQQQLAPKTKTPLYVLPVQPWGEFTPALNALIDWARKYHTATVKVVHAIWLYSSEVSIAPIAASVASTLLRHMRMSDTLVVGAALPGHEYHPPTSTDTSVLWELNGRTSPWNTLALWNLSKIGLTGFQLVSEGIPTSPKLTLPPSTMDHSFSMQSTSPAVTTTSSFTSAGIEEVVAIALLQSILGKDQAKAKLVHIPELEWKVDFDKDPARQAWHQQKMQSKLERASQQLSCFGNGALQGFVYHL